MIKKIFMGAFHLSLYLLAFLALAWFLLDINPEEAYKRSIENLQKRGEEVFRFCSDFNKTSQDMKSVSGYHLKQENERIHGKDPYEDTAKKFDELVLKR